MLRFLSNRVILSSGPNQREAIGRRSDGRTCARRARKLPKRINSLFKQPMLRKIIAVGTRQAGDVPWGGFRVRHGRPHRMPKCRTAALVACLCGLIPGGIAQKTSSAARAYDPFIAAIAAMKHSLGSLNCLTASGANPKILKPMGTAVLISQEADFVTAAHVLTAMQQDNDSCPTSAVTLAVRDWRPDAPAEELFWFPFRTADCWIDRAIDIAKCRARGDFPARIRNLRRAVPVQFAYNIEPDGTQLAFSGFPLEARDPMTLRAHVAAYQTPWPDDATPQLILDHPALPGSSGSPVFRADGKVIAILLRDGSPDAPGTSVARPVSAFRNMLGARQSKP
jgi:trypsin-like peptidase